MAKSWSWYVTKWSLGNTTITLLNVALTMAGAASVGLCCIRACIWAGICVLPTSCPRVRKPSLKAMLLIRRADVPHVFCQLFFRAHDSCGFLPYLYAIRTVIWRMPWVLLSRSLSDPYPFCIQPHLTATSLDPVLQKVDSEKAFIQWSIIRP